MHGPWGDRLKACTHNRVMVDQPDPDWFLRDWAAYKGKRQADLVEEIGWHKTTAHRLWHGLQPYRRDFLNQAAHWLGIQPYELLMRPSDALALRRLRETAAVIVAEDPTPPWDPDRRTGT